jgi:hypothetical protein
MNYFAYLSGIFLHNNVNLDNYSPVCDKETFEDLTDYSKKEPGCATGCAMLFLKILGAMILIQLFFKYVN